MEIIKIELNNPNTNVIKRAAEKIKYGGVVVYPSDTSYGLAANPKDATALAKLYSLKQSEKNKPIAVNVRDIEMAKQYCRFSLSTEQFFKKYLPGCVTLILPTKLPKVLPGENPAIRIPGTPVTNLLSDFLDIPYTATSANLSGEPSAYNSQEVIDYFYSQPTQPDIFLDAGDLPHIPNSTVVDLTATPPKIIRQGPVNIEF